MVKPLLLGVALLFVMAFVVACGGAADPEPTAVPATATTAPPTEAPTEAAMEEQETPEAMQEEDSEQQQQQQATTEDADEEDAMMEDIDPALVALADELAGGPGAIYIGDGNFGRLTGTPPGITERENEDGELVLDDPLGDGAGMVPLAFVEKNRHIFETDYYRSLLDKAKLIDPTPLTSVGEEINIQYACINRALLPCVLQTVYFAENVRARTNGQVDFEVSSYPGAGIGRDPT